MSTRMEELRNNLTALMMLGLTSNNLAVADICKEAAVSLANQLDAESVQACKVEVGTAISLAHQG